MKESKAHVWRVDITGDGVPDLVVAAYDDNFLYQTFGFYQNYAEHWEAVRFNVQPRATKNLADLLSSEQLQVAEPHFRMLELGELRFQADELSQGHIGPSGMIVNVPTPPRTRTLPQDSQIQAAEAAQPTKEPAKESTP